MAELPERPKETTEPADVSAAPKEPSKSALKKAAKDAEKAKKKAEREAAEAAQQKASEANDISKDDYGELPALPSKALPAQEVPHVSLAQIAEDFKDTTNMEEAGGPHIVFRGTVENARAQGAKLAFVKFRQGENTIQAVVAESETLSRQMVKFAGKIPSESVVLVHGIVKKPKELVKSTTISHLELHVKKLFVAGKADQQLPMQVADAERPIPAEGEEQAEDGRPTVNLNTRLNNRVIDLRARQNHAIFKIKSGVKKLFREFLEAKDFIEFETPGLLGAPSEGGANVFEVKYFNTKAYLAQSPQLYKQMLISARFQRVMVTGPVFRAENSNTARHLTEFSGLDLEMEFREDYHEVVTLIEELMLYIFNGLRTRYKKETDIVRSVYHVEDFALPEAGRVPRLSFKQGIAMLREDGVEVDEFEDLSTPDEKRLGALVLQKYGSDFFVLDKYPLKVRPFYTMPDPETYDPNSADKNAGYSNSYDFFMRGQEIMSGAQRIHDAAFLEKRMKECVTPVDPESEGLKDYVNAFRYGCEQHAGGGIGLERIVMLWLGLPNIRLASLFPRDPSRLAP